jgi:1-acyl-sn-glycerol-3-phosphate acyltransferase
MTATTMGYAGESPSGEHAMSQFGLLRQKRFGPLFWTQFLGAFNDNVLKNAIVILFAFTAASQKAADTLVNVTAAIFILPFFLFSATAGQVADKLEKSRLVRFVKVFEVGIMAVAALGFYRQSVPILLGSLFLMGVHSTVFGPIKYSILPQHLGEAELVGGNGLIEMGSFVAILLGTIGGGLAVAVPGRGTAIVSVVLIAVAIAGYLASPGIPVAAPTAPGLAIRWNAVAETWATLRLLRQNRTVLLSILGVSWFWFYGALFLAQFPGFCKQTLGGDERLVTLLLTVFSLGIGLGSLLCERLSRRKIELGLVPFGSIGLSLFAVDLFFASEHAGHDSSFRGVLAFAESFAGARILLDLGLIGLFGGFFIVPLYALIQQRSDPGHRSRIIAGNNVLNALFMVLAAALAVALRALGLSIPELFLVTAVLNAIVAVYIYTLIPEFLMRFLVWILVHTIYRLDERGLENIPDEGPAVLVCNHVSFVDPLLLAAACRRPARFVMDHRIFKIPVLNFIFRTGCAIPIAPAREDAALMDRAFEEVARALAAGDVVCIFPEGKITKTGEMNVFRPGIEHIIERTPVPVIPVALRGLWGSFFSRKGGSAMRKPFRRFWSKVGVVVGEPWPASTVTASALGDRVLALRGDER